MNEVAQPAPDDQANTAPSADEQLATDGIIDKVPGATTSADAPAEGQPASSEVVDAVPGAGPAAETQGEPEPAQKQDAPLYGGYTGIRVGDMARKQQAYYAAGNKVAGDAMGRKIDEVSQPVPKASEESQAS